MNEKWEMNVIGCTREQLLNAYNDEMVFSKQMFVMSILSDAQELIGNPEKANQLINRAKMALTFEEKSR